MSISRWTLIDLSSVDLYQKLKSIIFIIITKYVILKSNKHSNKQSVNISSALMHTYNCEDIHVWFTFTFVDSSSFYMSCAIVILLHMHCLSDDWFNVRKITKQKFNDFAWNHLNIVYVYSAPIEIHTRNTLYDKTSQKYKKQKLPEINTWSHIQMFFLQLYLFLPFVMYVSNPGIDFQRILIYKKKTNQY